MANEEHLDILKQGVEAWNKWRAENPEIKANLSRANLRKADLRRADLRRAILIGTNLFETNLFETNLRGANLTWAVLIGANLGKATLTKANLFGADLSEANLTGADLRLANLSAKIDDTTQIDDKWRLVWEIVTQGASERDLSGANLSETNLQEAGLMRANFHEADLRGANLNKANLREADLHGANLRGATLREVNLTEANLFGADLREADLHRANLFGADLIKADLHKANLFEADLQIANLSRADIGEANLSGANLIGANLVETNFTSADLTDCSIYGISAWNVKLDGATQSGLVITPREEPTIKVDNLEVAQFVYLLLNHKKLRDVLDAVTHKGVLILGRFGNGGLEVLQAIAAKLRELEYLPMIFDFERPEGRNYTETVKTLAGLSRFIIADLSGPSVPQELEATIPHFKIPFVPIIEKGRTIYALFVNHMEERHVLPLVEFENKEQLIKLLPEKVINPAEERHKERQKMLDKLFKPG